MSINTVLFDFDGTLANTIPGIMATMAAVKEKMRADYSMEEAFNLIGQPLAAMGDNLVGAKKSAAFVNEYFAQYPNCGASLISFFPGMVELVAKLRAKGLWVAIVTSKRGTSLNGNLEILKAAKDFDLLVTNDLTLHHKPHPEPIEYAMNQLGVSPKDCIMVGDTQYDLLAAEGAGVKSIGVTWGVEPEEQLKTSRPSYIVKTVAELEELISSLI